MSNKEALTQILHLSHLRLSFLLILSSSLSDRPWLTESQQVQKLQEKVYLALQHSLHMGGGGQEKLDKVIERFYLSVWLICSGMRHLYVHS